MTISHCWQHLVKLRKALEGKAPRIPHSTIPNISPISQEEARGFITEYEWLGNAGAARYCYGLTYSSHLAAVVCYARPTAGSAFASLIDAAPEGVFQLCRGASTHWAPKHAPSMLIAESLKMLQRLKRAQLVVAYADPAAGEIGTIYQAANAIYLGLTDSRGPGEYIINGRSYHPRSVHRLFGSARHEVLKRVDPAYVRLQRTKKHRYVFVLGKTSLERRRLAASLAPWVKPYPKREP